MMSRGRASVARLPSAWRTAAGRLRGEQVHARRVKLRVRQRLSKVAAMPPRETADVAGLRYVNVDAAPGIRRVGMPKRFRYVLPSGRTVKDPAVLGRIKSLVIPPAWTDVWICPDPRGHVQATGGDARRRKQYRYHSRWREVRDAVKYDRMLAFAAALPKIREQADRDLERPGMPRAQVLAAIVR